jgi:hypothetical protein
VPHRAQFRQTEAVVGIDAFARTARKMHGTVATHDAGAGRLATAAVDRISVLAAEWPGPAGSLALHFGLALLVLLWPPTRRANAPPERGIEVEIVSLPAGRAPESTDDGIASESASPLPEIAPGQPVESAPSERTLVAAPRVAPAMIRATRLMAADSLADPASREARLALLTLAEDDRMEQLCAVEAMEQIHAWRGDIYPDRLVTYAMADPAVSVNTIVAQGAAFRDARQWYTVSFRCEVTPDREQVVAFEFRVGDPIPREEWERRNLPDLY